MSECLNNFISCPRCTLLNEKSVNYCNACGNKLEDAESEYNHQNILELLEGEWVKPDGFSFIVILSKDSASGMMIQLDNNFTEKVTIENLKLKFSWNDLNKNWGDRLFTIVSMNSLQESVSGCIFNRKYPRPNDLKYNDLFQIRRKFLSSADIESFKTNGYLIIKNATSDILVKQARRAILHDMGKNGIPTELLVKFRSQSWCPGLRSDKDLNQPLINIFKESVVVPAIDDLLHIPHPYLHVPQVALIFPSIPSNDTSHWMVSKNYAHVDGVSTPTNGVEPGRLHSFSLLVGIALTNQQDDYCGNLTVFPGSHYKVSEKLNNQWNHQAKMGISEVDRKLGPGQLDWPENGVLPSNCLNDIQPLQLKLQPGDAVILHYQLAHMVAPNYRDDIRMQLYLRVQHSQHDHVLSLLNLWKDFNL